MTFSSFTANWSSVSGATDYRLDVSTSNTFTTYLPGYQDLDVGNMTSYPVTGLSREHDLLLPSASLQWVCYKPQFQRQKCKDVALHACGSERTKRNQCDFQQLYRALEQRKRCDRLSVGRIHKQHFHHLRTRLSGFECRKHDQLPRDRVKCEHELLLPGASRQWVCYKRQFQCQKCTDVALHACGSERTKRNQCDCHSFTAHWRSVSGAIDYRLDVSTNSSFITYVAGYQNLAVGN